MSFIIERYDYFIPGRLSQYLPMVLGSCAHRLQCDSLDIDQALIDLMYIVHHPEQFMYFYNTVNFIKTSRHQLDIEFVYDTFITAMREPLSTKKNARIIAHELYYYVVRPRMHMLMNRLRYYANDGNLAQLIVSLHDAEEPRNEVPSTIAASGISSRESGDITPFANT
jgi:hypothetical protein